MRKLLVTGVPGWLTNAFLESLARHPPAGLEEVRCQTFGAAKLPPLPGSLVKFTAVSARLEDPSSLELAAAGCDSVLHAAGLLHVRRTSDWYRVNTEGTANLLAAAKSGGVKRFVLVSSNAAAGRAKSREHRMAESDVPAPLSHYGKSKLLAEQLVVKANLEGVVVRPCMFYGPPVPARHIDIYRRIVTGKMPLVGSGEYARSLTHIENLVQGCRLALEHPRAPGQTYYIADEPVYSTLEVIQAMAAALNVTPRFLQLPAFVAPLSFIGDRMLASVGLYWQTLHLVGEADWHVGVSIRKAQTELGYTPTVTLGQGMKDAILWCRQQGLLSDSHP
jgi:nucleoside-diphosphate-sugar epimerase